MNEKTDGERAAGTGWINPTCPHCGKLIFPWLIERQPRRYVLLRAVLLLFLVVSAADFLWDLAEMVF